MIVTYTDKSYRITYDGVSMVENALDNPNLIQISVISGCTIMVAPNSYGITYLPNGDFRSWNLSGINTALARTDAHYIYARLNRTEKDALLLFSVNDYKFDGKISGVESSEENKDYYYIKIGKITNTNSLTSATLKREISYDGGYLSTPQGNEEDAGGWKKLFVLTTDNLINALKRFASFTVQGTLTVIGRIILNEKQISGIARESDESPVIDDETIPTTKYLQGKNLEYLRGFLLNKDRPDKAREQIRFLKGLISEAMLQANGGINVGEFFDSLSSGKGIGLFPNGRMQAESLELRSSLTVLELIFNRLSAQEGDTTYSESGLIESVETLDANTYRLPLRKRHDTDFTAFDWNDVIYGSVNDLATGGGNYRTSWMRVIGVNTTDNYIEVVLYPDAEVPGGKNYPPEPLMAITRRGNTSDEDRQSYWYISSYEKCICMLDGVTKPILEENNYSIIIGKMKRLSLFDNLPINYRQSYVFCRGIIRQDDIRVDDTGKPIYELVDRGIWSLAVAASKEPYYFEAKNEITSTNETSTVYHRGVKWQCLKTGTLLEPKWNSIGWAFLEGNGEFSIDFESSKGFSFFYGLIDTVIEAKFYHGYVDDTEDIMSTPGTVITWSRDTGMPAEDKSWYPSFVDGKKNKIHLISTDMGSQWLNARSVTFKISAVIPLGEENYLRKSEELQFNL